MKTYAGNGQYVLDYIRLIVKDENTDEELEWNLLSFMVEVSLFEDIMNPMSGYVAVLDSFNFNELLPLYGNEKFEIGFYTAGNEKNRIEYQGFVYKVSEKHRITEHTSGYTIRFCSEAALLSKRSFVNAGFEAEPHNIAKSIYNRYLTDITRKPLEVQQTKGIGQYTFGAHEPLEALSIISRRATGTDQTIAFTFYENNQEFRFESIQTMYQREPVAAYSNTQAGIYEDVKKRFEEQFESYQDIEIYEENSFMDRLMDGLHGSNHGFFDLINKTFTNFTYRKNERFDPSKSLGDRPDKKFVDGGQDIQTIKYYSGYTEQFFSEVDSLMKRKESETFKAKVSVFGDSAMKAGDVIFLAVPNWNTDQENVKTMFQGNVLIGSIRHTLTKDHYTQALGVMKDSYEETV